MSVEDPWNRFKEILEDPWKEARHWKEKTGGKVIGHLLPDVPEEILHSAGALPVAIEGVWAPDASHAQAHIPGYTCSHAMGAAEMAIRGDLSFLDGMIIPYVCDTTRNLFHLWVELFPQMSKELLRLPKRLDFDGTRDYLRSEYSRLAESVGRLTGRRPDTAAMRESLNLYNRSRAQLRRAHEKHGESPDLWTMERVHMLTASALRMPREIHLKRMEALPWNDSAGPEHKERIAVYVRGKVWDPPAVLSLLDELGFMNAGDEMVTGFRAVAADAPLDGDPLDALVQRHMATIAYPGCHIEPKSIVDGFVERVRMSGARGVLFLNPKFCEPAAFDTPDLQSALEKSQIPSLVLETSAGSVSPGRLRVRLEAFREMIAGDLP